jgi:hypothetical protein
MHFSAGGSMGIGCGVAVMTPGMPSWPSCRLTDSGRSGDRVLATGPTTIDYQRRVSEAGSGPSAGSFSVDGPSGADRLADIAALGLANRACR